jgi:hypothetical protein
VKDVVDLAEVMAGAAEITNSFLEDKLLIQFVAILFLGIAESHHNLIEGWTGGCQI